MTLIRKRKLTKNQTRRIAENSSVTADDDALLTGVIVAHFGKQLDVQLTQLPATNDGDHGVQIGQIIRCHTRTNLPMLATNDGVLVSYDAISALGRIEKLLPRNNLLARPDRYHKLKPIASNVDILAIVFAPLPLPAANLIDRYLLIAQLNDVKPLLVLNKMDLLQTDELPCHERQAIEDIYEQYQSLGFEIVATSTTHASNLSTLQTLIQDKISLFVGQSGVGKSSLINALLPQAMQSVNAISQGSKLGQHTTTTSRLLAYDDSDLSAGIIDTPGIREYGIWHLSKNDIQTGFPELKPFIGLCQFRDCQHTQNSKGCALWQAVAEGKILARRVDSLVALQTEAHD